MAELLKINDEDNEDYDKVAVQPDLYLQSLDILLNLIREWEDKEEKLSEKMAKRENQNAKSQE